MYIKELSILNFKNIEQADLLFSTKLNCFVGNNGQGKTNVIDAIHYLSMCRSAISVSDGQCIKHGTDFFMVEGAYDFADNIHEKVTCSAKKGTSKIVKRNGKEYLKLSEHIGHFPLVMVSTFDTAIINDAAEERRRFINLLISQIDRDYLIALVGYTKILAERNKLLKELFNKELLEVLDMQLVRYGTIIYEKRDALIKQIAPIVERYYLEISGDKERVEMSYRSDLQKKSMEDILIDNYQKDTINQYTTSGVHRDDIKMSIMDYPIRKYGSQGQQKSFLIALKLAQFDVIAARKGVKPLMLLDDIFDKLDMERVENLIKIVSRDSFGQIFITDSNKVRLETILTEGEGSKFFNVNKGVIE